MCRNSRALQDQSNLLRIVGLARVFNTAAARRKALFLQDAQKFGGFG
jgi:hypothetical protein